VNVTLIPFQGQLQYSVTWFIISQLKIFSTDRVYIRLNPSTSKYHPFLALKENLGCHSFIYVFSLSTVVIVCLTREAAFLY